MRACKHTRVAAGKASPNDGPLRIVLWLTHVPVVVRYSKPCVSPYIRRLAAVPSDSDYTPTCRRTLLETVRRSDDAVHHENNDEKLNITTSTNRCSDLLILFLGGAVHHLVQLGQIVDRLPRL